MDVARRMLTDADIAGIVAEGEDRLGMGQVVAKGQTSDPGHPLTRQEQLRQAGRLGGITILEKYGLEHYRDIGKLGGRPTWQEALAKARAQEMESRKGRKRPAKPVSRRMDLRLDEATALKIDSLAQASGYSRCQVVRLLIEAASLADLIGETPPAERDRKEEIVEAGFAPLRPF